MRTILNNNGMRRTDDAWEMTEGAAEVSSVLACDTLARAFPIEGAFL